MSGLFNLGTLGDALGVPSENPIMLQKPANINDTTQNRITDNREALQRGGVTVKIPGVKFDFQTYPIHVDTANTRYDFEFLTKNTNSRVVGFMMTSNEAVDNELRSNINHSTIQLTIDNEEIIPSGVSAAMFSHKNGLGFYDNMYVMNEKAGASQVKGCYTSGGAASWNGEYDVTLYLYSIKN